MPPAPKGWQVAKGSGLRDKPKRVPGLKQDLNTGWEVRREAGVKPGLCSVCRCMETRFVARRGKPRVFVLWS